MSKKPIIVTVLILMAAFFAGWAIQRWFNPFSKSASVGDNTSSVSVQRGMGAGQGQGFRQMVSALRLTDEQISVFSEIESAYRTRMHTYMRQLDSIDLAILEELKSKFPNEEKLDSLASRAGHIQYHLKKTTADHFSAIKNLCTPDQKKRFNEVINDLNKFKRGQGQGRGQGFGRRGQGRGRNHFN